MPFSFVAEAVLGDLVVGGTAALVTDATTAAVAAGFGAETAGVLAGGLAAGAGAGFADSAAFSSLDAVVEPTLSTSFNEGLAASTDGAFDAASQASSDALAQAGQGGLESSVDLGTYNATQAAIDSASQATGSELSSQAGSDAINEAASNLQDGQSFMPNPADASSSVPKSVFDKAIDSLSSDPLKAAQQLANITNALTKSQGGTGTVGVNAQGQVGGSAGPGGGVSGLLGAGIGAGINALTGQSASGTAANAAAAADPFGSQRKQYQVQLQNLMTPGSNFQSTDPSYNYRLQQGENAVNAGAASSGLLNSGNRLTALQTQGQSMASTEFQNQYARLAQLSGANSGSTGTAGQIVANSGQAAQAGTSAIANNLANTGASYLNSLFGSSGTTQAPSAATDAAAGYAPQTDSSQTASQAFGTMPGTAYDPSADYSNIV